MSQSLNYYSFSQNTSSYDNNRRWLKQSSCLEEDRQRESASIKDSFLAPTSQFIRLLKQRYHKGNESQTSLKRNENNFVSYPKHVNNQEAVQNGQGMKEKSDPFISSKHDDCVCITKIEDPYQVYRQALEKQIHAENRSLCTEEMDHWNHKTIELNGEMKQLQSTIKDLEELLKEYKYDQLKAEEYISSCITKMENEFHEKTNDIKRTISTALEETKTSLGCKISELQSIMTEIQQCLVRDLTMMNDDAKEFDNNGTVFFSNVSRNSDCPSIRNSDLQ